MGRMTENMKSEAVRLYFEENREPDEIARQIRVREDRSKMILSDLKRLEAYRKKSGQRSCARKSAFTARKKRRGIRRLLSQSGGTTTSARGRQKGHPRPGGHSDAKDCEKDVVIRFAAGAPAWAYRTGRAERRKDKAWR